VTETVDLNTPVDITGISLTSNLGSISITGDANLTLTGQALTSAIGTVDAVVVAEVTGIAMTSAIGSVTTVANANVIVSGQSLTSKYWCRLILQAWAED
jgi:hypothetical protein